MELGNGLQEDNKNIMPKKNPTLEDVVGKPEKIVFSVPDMKEFAASITKKYEGFDRRGFNRFLSKNNIARIAWAFTRKNGKVDTYYSGRVMAAVEYPYAKGTKIWKGYECQSTIPLFFWEELYNQTCAYFGKQEYASQQQLAGYADIAEQIGTKIPYEEQE